MKNRMTAFGTALLALFVSGPARAESLNLLIWESYIDEDI